MKRFCQRYEWILVAVLFLGLVAQPAEAAEGKSSAAQLNDGYSTFYQFCDQESQLSLLLYVKTTPPKIADFAKRVSDTAKEDMAILKKFAASDKDLRLDKVSLPGFELQVRKSMDDDRRNELLWKNSGANFARSVCMTQSEATNYGLHVAKILAETEPDTDRARVLQRIFKKWTALHEESYALAQ